MMNLDEAIQYHKEKAKELKSTAGRFAYPDKAGTTKESADCLECANEHEQLAEWLTELKNMKDCIKTECFKCAKDKATIDNAPTVETYCYFCGQTEHGKVEKKLQGEWIPVSERLPIRNGVYIVTRIIEGTRITDASYFDGQNTWHRDVGVNHGRPYLNDVIAWQPRPEPYKEGGSENG